MIYLNQHYFSSNRKPGVFTNAIIETGLHCHLDEVADIIDIDGGISDDKIDSSLRAIKKYNQRDYEVVLHLFVIKLLKQANFKKLSQQVSEHYEEVMDDERFIEADPDFILRGLQSDLMREISSKTRHKHYDEIIQIIKNTWEKYPSGSKKEMVRQIVEHFKGEVNESTLLRWIKKENLTPPRPSRYTTLTLV
ncbi:hypothetical protein FNH55_11450, partial [Salmonella enterica subsp. salamae]|nr:hypothetical protein [Salmonella enterica subsp. salamae]